MKAMILAAGLGTRLKPFTNLHPKALYVVGGKTLLEHAVLHLKTAGVDEIIVNVHHFAEQIVDFIHLNQEFGLKMSISDETGELLETGGGLKKAAWFFEDCDSAIIRNVDILSDLDLRKMTNCHRDSASLVTLAVRDRPTSRYFLFNDRMELCGWENRGTGELRFSQNTLSYKPFAFSGMQIIDTKIFAMMIEEGNFSLTDLYLRLARTQKIKGYMEEGIVWKDVGRLTPNSACF